MGCKTVWRWALTGLASFGLLSAEQTPSKALLVLSKGDHTLAIVNPETRKVVARFPSGPDPHEVIASSDGHLAFISNYGGGAYNTLTVVDLVRQRPLPTVDLGALRGPHGLTFVGGKVWFTAEAAKAFGSYDPTTRQVNFILGTGQDRTHMIFVSPDQKQIVTSNVSSATMSIIEKVTRRPGFGSGSGGPPPIPPNGTNGGPAPPRGPGPGGPMGPPGGDWSETVVPVGKGAEGFDVSPDGKEIWAANAQDGTISILDFPGKKVVQTLDANVPGANRLKFTPDGKSVFVSSLRGSDVAVFDAVARKELKRISAGHGAAGIQMEPDGSRVYVACTPDNYVVVIDLKTMAVVNKIDAGKEPDGLAWAVQR